MKRRITFDIRKYGIYLALLLVVLFFCVASDKFLTPRNLINIARQVAVVGICAAGMSFVIIAGCIDVGIGSALGMSAVIAAFLMSAGVNMWVAMFASMAGGVLIGIVNAFLICNIGMHHMIATMGMQIFLRGVILLITSGMPIYGIDERMLVLGQGYIGSIPVPVIIMAIIFVIGFVLLNKTTYGRELYATGGNAEASRLSGVNVKKAKYTAFIISGLMTALAGLILAARVNSGQPNAGERYESDVIPACVLGGVSLRGGEGSLIGVIAGVLIMGVLTNGMILLNVNEYWQWTIKGLVLLLAVSFDRWSQVSKDKAITL